MKIAIIGGGAAGLMACAALHEADPEAEIFLLEKNEALGKKVVLSGGGRCNLTTGLRDIRAVLAHYPRGGRFLTKAMNKFSPADAYDWFESHGIPLKVEADLRVFPVSNDGHDVVRMFERIFRHPKIHVLLDAPVSRIEKTENGFVIRLKNRTSPVQADKVILTTGGQAYRQTGSTGDGYALAAALGHPITPLAPSLSALKTKESWPAWIAGIPVPRAMIRAGSRKATGPLLFTHTGLTGPAVFAFSSLVAFEAFDAAHPLAVFLDLFPETRAELLQQDLRSAMAGNKKSLSNVLAAFIPKSLSEIACQELGLLAAGRANETGKKEVARITAWLKGIPLRITGRVAGDEFVTAGGVDLAAVNPSTMESKICPGLFLAGEILDIDGFTGGFNLQSAWATGHLAGTSTALPKSSGTR